MIGRKWIAFLMVLVQLVGVLDASAGDANPHYRNCVAVCENTGCIGERCFPRCKSPTSDGPWYMRESLYNKLKQMDCQGDCRYYCMVDIEEARAKVGHEPIKYHGKWPFKRVFGMQEPVSVALSLLNLTMHLYGWLSFSNFLNNKLPLRPTRIPYYDYSSLWSIYALFSVNAWFWSAVFHSRDVDVTEKLDYSSAVALLGYSFILSILRSFNVRLEAARVMISAPLLAFITTHILYLNNYQLDYGWNMKVCVAMGIAQLLTWSIWAGVSRHPSRWKLWVVVVGGALAMMLEIYDFAPYGGYVDAHALWHASTIPLTYIWWSFIKDDAQLRTSVLLKKTK